MSIRQCPSCSKRSYRYGWDNAKSVIDLFKPSRYALASVIGSLGKTAIINVATNFALAFRYPYNPLLYCNNCGIYCVQCPECKEYLILSKQYPKIKATYLCSDCKTEFRLCGKTPEFDRDLNN